MDMWGSGMDGKLNWDDLIYLVALDRYGGLKKAADHLGSSHQTAARRLQSLEHALDTRLTDTSGRSWSLTKKGREILAVALQMEQNAEEVLRLSNVEAADFVGRVGISSVSWGMDLIIMPALKEIQSKYPDISFDLISDDGMQSIEAGDVDLCLRFTRSPPPDLIGKKVGAVQLGVYGVRSHADALKEGRHQEVALIRSERGFSQHDPWINREDGPKRKMLVNDLQTMLLAARNGLGVAVLPTVVASNETSLVRIDSEPIAAQNSAWILRHQDSRHSNKVRAIEISIIATGKAVLAAS